MMDSIIQGQEKFADFFNQFPNSYVLIGGVACKLYLAHTGVASRATKDFDVILVYDKIAESQSFSKLFYKFVQDAGYIIDRTKKNGFQHYRFQNAQDKQYPEQIELLSHADIIMDYIEQSRHMPIPTPEDLSNLSAIVLDEDYYRLVQQNHIKIKELNIASPECLVVLKAHAWLNNLHEKEKGNHCNTKDIKKHKTDTIRLIYAIRPATSKIQYPSNTAILKDMLEYFRRIAADRIEVGHIVNDSTFTKSECLSKIKQIFFSNTASIYPEIDNSIQKIRIEEETKAQKKRSKTR